jgi:membrane protein YqaA with SNARE-associated domain
MRWAKHPKAVLYLGGLSFAESSFFPVPPDVMLIPMSLARRELAFRYALLTTITSVIGGVLGYLIGYFAYASVEPLLFQWGYQEPLIHARSWFHEWGVWIIFIAGFSPIPYKLFTITAGALSMAFLPFTLASAIGRGSRFFLVAWLVRLGGPAIEPKIRQYIEALGWATVLLLVLLIYLINF